MMNTLPDLNNILFEQIERINDDELKGEELEEQLKKSKAIKEIAGTIVANASVILKAVKFNDEVPDTVPRNLISVDPPKRRLECG